MKINNKLKSFLKINKLVLLTILILILIILLFYKSNIKLENEVNSLKQQNQEINAELSLVSSQLEQTESKIEDTKSLLDNFENQIQDSIEWFKDNSNIKDIKEYNSIKDLIRIRCIRVEDKTCKIKLSCLPFVHDTIKDFEYKFDSESFGKEDKLQSLIEFYNNKGGDCEDYSLVINSELNYAFDYCKEKGSNNFEIEAIKEGYSNYDVDFIGDWYFENIQGYKIPQDYIYHYVVCGNFPSEVVINTNTGEEIVGHCAIAFTDIKIDSSNDIYNSLKNSIIIESQSGDLLYKKGIGNSQKMIILNKAEDMFNDYYIYSVITENDYYIFYNYEDDSVQWVGYKDFTYSIEDMKNELNLL